MLFSGRAPFSKEQAVFILEATFGIGTKSWSEGVSALAQLDNFKKNVFVFLEMQKIKINGNTNANVFLTLVYFFHVNPILENTTVKLQAVQEARGLRGS